MAVFLFFYKTDFIPEDKKMLLRIIVLQGATLTFVAALFFAFPQYGNKIPGMNLIFSTYGHNHLGAVLLLVNPLVFWFYLQKKRPLFFLLFVAFCGAMVLSFGRTVIFLGLVQLLCLFFLYKQRQKISLPPRSRILVFLVGAVFLGALALYFHSATYGSCLFGDISYEEKLCKTELGKNVRYFYWQQGWEAFTAKPFFGYGIGAFGSVSSLYRQIPEYQSTFAHNDYLQMFAEGGIFVGCVFLALLGVGYRRAASVFADPKAMFIPLSLFSIGIDIFFDFDFHFLSIAFLVFLLCALILDAPIPTRRQFPVSRTRPVLVGLLAVVMISCTVYMATDRLIAAKQEGAAYRIFPFFHWHALNFMGSDQLTLAQKERLSQVYWANRAVQAQWVELQGDEQKAGAEYASWQGDPWRKTASFLPGHYFDAKDFDSLEKVMGEITEFLDEKRLRFGYQKESISFVQKEQWAHYLVALAEEHFQKKQYATAAAFLRKAYYYNEWSFVSLNKIFSDFQQEQYEEEMQEFLKGVDEIPALYFGDNRLQLAQMYYQQTLLLLKSGKDDGLLYRSAQRALEASEASARWLQQEVFSTEQPQFWHTLLNADADSFYRHALLLHAIRSHAYEIDGYYDYGYYEKMTSGLLHPLQRYVDAHSQESDFSKTAFLLDTLAQNLPDLYWWQAQRGYWYGTLGKPELAQKAFEECLTQRPDHEDCQHGLQNLLEKNGPDVKRYYEVREILLGL